MADGRDYVFLVYSIVMALLVIWLWTIGAKVRRLDQRANEQRDADAS